MRECPFGQMVSKWSVVPRISRESSFMPSHLALDISVNSAFLKHPISLQRMEWEISQCCWTGDRSPLISVLKLFAGTWDKLQMPDKVGCWDLVSQHFCSQELGKPGSVVHKPYSGHYHRIPTQAADFDSAVVASRNRGSAHTSPDGCWIEKWK